MEPPDQPQQEFLEALWEYYARSARDTLPWRQARADGIFDPYGIMVSELMLQQTQVSRVIPKYESFLKQFPDVQALAGAELGDVLRAWQGLGYNRRAKFLWLAARELAAMPHFPDNETDLTRLPGIGKNTAGAIQAYAFNRPAVFVETNIRTVYIHHFFSGEQEITDNDISNLVAQTLDQENPREFYWALMDYGSYLKTTVGNLSKASKHYTKQSAFHGSRRQIRGQVLRELGTQIRTDSELRASVHDERLQEVLDDLLKEGLIRKNGSSYSL